MKKTRKSIMKIAAIACCTMLSITGVVFAKDIGNFVKEFFGGNSSEGVDTAVNNGYVADANTEYQNAEGIDLKIDTILMDDFNFDMNFNVIISNKYDIKEFEKEYPDVEYFYTKDLSNSNFNDRVPIYSLVEYDSSKYLAVLFDSALYSIYKTEEAEEINLTNMQP